MNDEEMKKPSRGGRNLVILGIAAVVVALATTAVSIVVYHRSGDIYLDRSRPGYLPDEEEIKQEEQEKETTPEYELPAKGPVTVKALEEYLEYFETEMKAVDAYEDPFGEKVLSDENLGIGE